MPGQPSHMKTHARVHGGQKEGSPMRTHARMIGAGLITLYSMDLGSNEGGGAAGAAPSSGSAGAGIHVSASMACASNIRDIRAERTLGLSARSETLQAHATLASPGNQAVLTRADRLTPGRRSTGGRDDWYNWASVLSGAFSASPSRGDTAISGATSSI